MIKLKEANTLYICTNEKKEILLKQMSHDKEIFDIKFMTLNEFMEQYFFYILLFAGLFHCWQADLRKNGRIKVKRFE